jgi:hypothetical protein
VVVRVLVGGADEAVRAFVRLVLGAARVISRHCRGKHAGDA